MLTVKPQSPTWEHRMTIASVEEAAETTIYDILRRIVDSTIGGDLNRDITKMINKLDPDAEDPVEPVAPVDPKDAEIAALQAQLAAAQGTAPAAEPAAPAF
jgi:hypothetical protein